jgi:hypothetical protein
MAKAYQAPPAVSASTDALSALVRLLACQAAREWADAARQADLPKPVESTKESEK